MTSEQTHLFPKRDRQSWRSSFAAAGRGVIDALRTQRNMRVHTFASVVVVAAGAWLKCEPIEWGLLALAMGLVLTAELLNTAMEAVVDLVSPDWHILAKRAKDAAAGGVLIAAFTAAVVGVCVLGPRLWALLSVG